MSFSRLMTLSQLRDLGVHDERWTVHDKLQMYKGLIKIYNREQKNQIKDTNVLKKKNFRKIATLQKEVRELQCAVATTVNGDKTLIRRTLQNHRDLQLTYQNVEPHKIVEDMNHRIFCKKKQLDLIRYKKSQGEEKLIETQVHLGDLKYLIASPGYGRTDMQQQTITNQIQNYVVKFCAAKNIQGVYKRMLAVLHKDQRYYEAILVTLQSDSNIQHKCLIRATEMGQLAMEDMANMKAEYTRLEKEVRYNMTERERCLKDIRARLVQLYEESQGLVRTESEFDMQMMQEEPKKKGRDLEQEVKDLDALLLRMQDVTLVPKFCDIFPRMLETLRQKKRLLEELHLNAAACDDLLNKKNHAELKYYALYHTGSEAAEAHNAMTEDLKKKIQKQKKRLGKILEEQGVLSKQSVNLRVGLQRLCHILEEVKLPKDYVDSEVMPWPVKELAISLRPKQEVLSAGDQAEVEASDLSPINEDAQRLIHLLDVKMRFIKGKIKEQGDPAEQERAFVARLKHVTDRLAGYLYPEEEVAEAPALILDIVMEDPQVPNRLEIKARSHEIYVEATRNPYEVVEVKKPKKKKDKKK